MVDARRLGLRGTRRSGGLPAPCPVLTAADRLIIDSPTSTGLIVLKALAPEPGLMAQAQATLAASSCSVQTEPTPVKVEEPKPAPPPPAPRPKR